MYVRIAAFVVAVVLCPARTSADATEDAALAHLDRGIAAFDAKEFARAHAELSASQQLAPHKPNPYRWLALTEIQLGDCASALTNIEAFLARVPATDARVAEMTRWQALCRRRVQPAVTGTRALADPPRQPEDRPLRTRWWFWPAVGSAALVATGATIYFATRTEETVLPSIHCDAEGCR